MTDREKLVELLEAAESAVYWDSGDKSFIEKIADHLIENGVTVNGKRIECTFSIPIDAQEILRKVIEETEVDGKTLAEWIALLKDYKQQEWIPVEDDLPYMNELVLVTDGSLVKEAYYNGRAEWICNGHDMEQGGVVITHWKRKPEPPKEAQ